MKIIILGSGAMGSIFGSYIWQINKDILLLDVWKEHVEKINNEGLLIEAPNGLEKRIFINANFPSYKKIPIADLLIVFVKSYQTEKALSAIDSAIGPNTKILTLQNGLGNDEKIAKFVDHNRIYIGGTAQGGAVISPGKVRHRIAGHTYVGKLTGGEDTFLLKIEKLFNKAGIPTTVLDDVKSVIWSKLILNVAFNALTALTQLRNGDFIGIKEGKKLLSMAVGEAVCVAEAKGIKTNYDDPVKACFELGSTTVSKNITSMLNDVLKNRKTEIDSINGAIVKESKELGISSPVNETLTLLIKIIEKTYDKKVSLS